MADPAARGTPQDRPGSSRGVCGVIVTYLPSESVTEVMESAASQLDTLFVWDNSVDLRERARVAGIVEDCRSRVAASGGPRNVELVQPGHNLGLSIGYNHGARYAIDAGAEWILLLDQDSQLAPGAVSNLIAEGERLQRRFRVGTISALNRESVEVPVSPRQAIERLSDAFDEREYRRGRLYRDGTALEVRSFTNSGTLVSLRALSAVGGFDESLFLDSVDFRLSVRLSEEGFRMFETPSAIVNHSQGRQIQLGRLGLGLRARFYPPERSFHIVKDSVRFARLSFASHPRLTMGVLSSVFFGTLGAIILLPQRMLRITRASRALLEGLTSHAKTFRSIE